MKNFLVVVLIAVMPLCESFAGQVMGPIVMPPSGEDEARSGERIDFKVHNRTDDSLKLRFLFETETIHETKVAAGEIVECRGIRVGATCAAYRPVLDQWKLIYTFRVTRELAGETHVIAQRGQDPNQPGPSLEVKVLAKHNQRPLPGAWVQITDAWGEGQAAEAQTNERGIARFGPRDFISWRMSELGEIYQGNHPFDWQVKSMDMSRLVPALFKVKIVVNLNGFKPRELTQAMDQPGRVVTVYLDPDRE